MIHFFQSYLASALAKRDVAKFLRSLSESERNLIQQTEAKDLAALHFTVGANLSNAFRDRRYASLFAWSQRNTAGSLDEVSSVALQKVWTQSRGGQLSRLDRPQ